jgi:hypothetical protein
MGSTLWSFLFWCLFIFSLLSISFFFFFFFFLCFLCEGSFVDDGGIGVNNPFELILCINFDLGSTSLFSMSRSFLVTIIDGITKASVCL